MKEKIYGFFNALRPIASVVGKYIVDSFWIGAGVLATAVTVHEWTHIDSDKAAKIVIDRERARLEEESNE